MPRTVLIAASLAFALLAGCSASEAQLPPGKTLRVGFQKGSVLSSLKASGLLENRLSSLATDVTWHEFPSGPPLLEALNAGSIDLGHTGDSPPLFAQAAGVPFAYLAASSPSPESIAVVVRRDGPIRSPEDLRGKRVGLVKGSSGHTLLLKGLPALGLTFDDVESVYLVPADASAARASGSIDAWATWDPYLAAVELGGDVRVLISGTGYISGREYYLTARRLVEERPWLARVFLEELARSNAWAGSHPSEVAATLAPQLGMDVAVIERAERRRRRYSLVALTDALAAEQ